MKARFAVFASGSGTNMESLLDHEERGSHYSVVLAVTDRPCVAEQRARSRGIPHCRVDFSAACLPGGAILDVLRLHRIEGVLLAGFLRLIPADVCQAFHGRVLNIHPALLPSFGGQGMYGERVHKAVLQSGAGVSGPTIHFVTERYDDGPIVAQWPVPVLPGDTSETLAARVLKAEHALLPAAADALAKALARGWPDNGPAPRVVWTGRGAA